MARRLELLLWSTTVAVLVLAAVSVVAHMGSSRGLTHTVGVFVVLAELLRDGVLYPAPTTDLVYSVFYHPLAFAPLALLPGQGLELLPALRLLVGIETLVCLFLLVWLCARIGLSGALALVPAALALLTVPVSFSLLGMRDDPRAALLALAAIVLHVHHGRHWPVLSGLLLGLAFFAKATAPFAPLLALLHAAGRQGRTAVLQLLLSTLLVVAAGIVVLQYGLETRFLDNGLRFLLEGARPQRDLASTLAALGTDLTRDLLTPLLCGASLLAWISALLRRRISTVDVLVAAAWLKTFLAYRSHGTDLNHLLDLILFSSLQLAGHLLPWLRIHRGVAVMVLAGLLCIGADMLGRTSGLRLLLPDGRAPGLLDAPVAGTVAGLRLLDQTSPKRTLCEEPLVGHLSQKLPLVTDPFLTFAALRGHPEIRARWFGPVDDPAAVRRVVLMHDPTAAGASEGVRRWYSQVHFDVELVELLEREWTKVVSTDHATVFER